MFADDLAVCPHYNLDDNLLRAVTHVLTAKPSSLLANLDFAKRPHSIMWVEFATAPRFDTLDHYGIDPDGRVSERQWRKQPERVGWFLQDHPNFPGERLAGMATICWRHKDSDVPDIGYSQLVWDFRPQHPGVPIEMPREAANPNSPHNTIYLHRRNPKEVEAYRSLLKHFMITESWFHYDILRVWESRNLRDFERLKQGSLGDASSEDSTVLATLMLLNTYKAADYHLVDRSKLNKNRIRKGVLPYLDYSNVVLHVRPSEERRYTRAGLSRDAGVALHKVRGHLKRVWYGTNRQESKIIWLDDYTRGDETFGIRIANRTVKL